MVKKDDWIECLLVLKLDKNEAMDERKRKEHAETVKKLIREGEINNKGFKVQGFKKWVEMATNENL